MLNEKTLRVEMGGVNRKQAEVSLSLPRSWAVHESPLRALVQEGISRGRVQVSIMLEDKAAQAGSYSINPSKLQSLQEQLREVEQTFGQPVALSLEGLTRLGILEEAQPTELTEEEIWTVLEPTAKQALANFLSMRAQEGEFLKQDMLSRIASLRTLREQMMQRAPLVLSQHRERLLQRLAEAGLPLGVEDERLIKEIALFADKCDISEEMSRLSSHFDQFEALSAKDEPLGRTLDFLCQEIFRELNTTGSKANDATLAQLVVTAKTELEKIREQVQNIE